MKATTTSGNAALPEGAAAYIDAIQAADRDPLQSPTAIRLYGTDPQQSLAVFVPRSGIRPGRGWPVLIFLHGGAWIRGKLGWLTFMAPAATALPAILVGVAYRLAPGDRWPAQLDDTRAALRYVERNIAGFGGDPQRIVIGGHSAGGQLAAMAVLTSNEVPVLGCLPVSAPCDLRYGDVDPESEAGRVYKYLLKERSDDAAASPICRVDGNRTPFHLMWGEHDFARITDSSRRFVDALAAAGSPVTEQVVAGAGHFDTHRMLESAANPWYRAVASMLGIEQPAG